LQFFKQLIDSSQCVDSGRKPETDGVTARKILALVLEAYRKAAAEGANV
jgi:hypothetical protein